MVLFVVNAWKVLNSQKYIIMHRLHSFKYQSDFFTLTYRYRAILHLKLPNEGNMLSHIFPMPFFCITLFQHLPNRCAIPDLWHLEALHGFIACFNLFAPQKLWQQKIVPSVPGLEERHLFRDTQWSQHAWSQSSATDQWSLWGRTQRLGFTGCVFQCTVPALCLKDDVWSWKTAQMLKI